MFDHCPSISLRSKTYDEVENSCCRDLQRQISFSDADVNTAASAPCTLPCLYLGAGTRILHRAILFVRIVSEGWSFIKVLPGRDRWSSLMSRALLWSHRLGVRETKQCFEKVKQYQSKTGRLVLICYTCKYESEDSNRISVVEDPLPQVLQLWTMSTRSTLSRIFV